MMDPIDTAAATPEQRAYQARKKRVEEAFSLQKPDRVPLACLDDYFSLARAGLTPRDAYYEPGPAGAAHVEQIVQLNWDMVSLHGAFPGQVAETIDLKTVKWAGGNLPDTQEFQYVEKEYLLADEYDQFLKNPGDFVLRTLWPRMAGGLEAFGSLPNLLLMSHSWAPITEIAMLAGQPEVREMLEMLIRLGEEINAYNAALDRTIAALEEKGFPVLVDMAAAHAPFDWVSDYFRGIKGTMLDMYYRPDKLKAAIELLTPPIIDYAIQSAQDMGNTLVGIPLHRGADPFMSNDQFAEFYWPGLKALLLAVIDAGLTPFPYWEGSYTNRLPFLQELPAGKIWGHFDVIDRKKAKEMIGDTMCFWGNVPAQILISGTPEQTRDDVRELIDIFGDNGGLVIDGAVGIPKEAKLENVIAMTEAVFEYGVY